jgi:hypothetical protein
MGYTNVWDITQPPDTQAANLLGQDLRTFRLDTMQHFAFMSGLDAAKPTPENSGATANWQGLLFFATDTNKVYQWSGTAWVDISASMVAGALASAGGPVIISGVPSLGQPLVATGPNAASWGATSVFGFKIEEIDSTIVTVANTVTPTSLYSFSIPGNELNTNQTLSLRLYGDYGEGPVTGDSVILTIQLDSTTVALLVPPPFEAANSQRWNLEFDLFCIAGGSGGSVEGHGTVLFYLGGGTGNMALGGGGTSVGAISTRQSFDMTAAHTLNVLATWSNNTVNDTITKRLARLVRIG